MTTYAVTQTVSPTITQPARQRRQDAYERSINAIRAFRETATPEEMERIANSLERAISPKTPEKKQSPMLTALTGKKTLSPAERMELRTQNLARYFALRRILLDEALSAPQVAQLLGSSRQTPHDRVKAKTLLAVRDRGGLRFPLWQFDANASDGVLNGLPQILSTFCIEPLEIVNWFVTPNPTLNGRTPLDALRAGEIETLVALASGVGAN